MHIHQPAATRTFARAILCWLAFVCSCALPVFAQQTLPAGSVSGNGPIPLNRAVITLESQWRFHTGDDLRWADPNFNDSDWPIVNLSTPLVEQGIDSYTGWGWYRLKIQPQQFA